MHNIGQHEKYMYRCLQLALNGKGYVSPNPMVGSVIVHEGRIIGEGYHREYGKAHAEVNAINSVEDKSLLKESTIYVSLEPCSHFGKTPPCSQLIIDHKIPRVVVATADPYHEVSGRGIRMLRNAGIKVTVGILEKEAQELNKEFFTAQLYQRPYIYLKWAQTKDGFIDKRRTEDSLNEPSPISNDLTQLLVHKMRAETDAIMVATNTAINDNPSLTTRLWSGHNPIRIVLDRNRRIPENNKLFDNKTETILFTEKAEKSIETDKTIFLPLSFDAKMIRSLLKELNKRKINSLLIEGGAKLLRSFIEEGAWDEARIEIADKLFFQGTKAPVMDGILIKDYKIGSSQSLHLKNPQNYKIL